MLANMTKRGSLAVYGYGGAFVARRHLTDSYLSDMVSYTTGTNGYPVSIAKGFPRAGLSGIEEIGTINCIGYRVYVDHTKTESGDGLSWETAYANLNDLLNDPVLHYTCVSQRQVIHAFVRGEVNYPIYSTSLGSRRSVLDYYGYLVIHDCTFYYDLRVDSSSLCATYGEAILSCISVSGLVFHSCHFTVIQPDGVKGTDGVDNEEGTSGTDGGMGGDSLTKGVYLGETESDDQPMYSTEVALVCGDCAYFYECTFNFTCGNGGHGGKGATAYTATESVGGRGGTGGNGGQIHIMNSGACALYNCLYTITVGSGGNGGDGGDGYAAGNGGQASAEYSIVIIPYGTTKFTSKAFGCTFTVNIVPTQHGGSGGKGVVVDGNHGEWGGNGGGCNVYLEIIAYGNINKCTFTLLQDLAQCAGGEGGEHTYTYDNGTTIDAAGDSGNMQSSLTFTGGRIKNSHIQLNIQHNGQGGELQECKAYVYLDAAFATTIGMHNTCNYTPLTRIRNSAFVLYVPKFSITIAKASNVDAAITQGNIDQLPDGVRQDKYVDDGIASYAYQKGGCVSGRNWLSVSASKYATELSATQDYGLSVTVQKPGGVTCGYPGGGILGGAFGYIVHGRDGRASWNDVVSMGGNGSAAFTWMNWAAPAGTFGHGSVDDPSSDGTLLSFNGTDYNTDIVSVSFV